MYPLSCSRYCEILPQHLQIQSNWHKNSRPRRTSPFQNSKHTLRGTQYHLSASRVATYSNVIPNHCLVSMQGLLPLRSRDNQSLPVTSNKGSNQMTLLALKQAQSSSFIPGIYSPFGPRATWIYHHHPLVSSPHCVLRNPESTAFSLFLSMGAAVPTFSVLCCTMYVYPGFRTLPPIPKQKLCMHSSWKWFKATIETIGSCNERHFNTKQLKTNFVNHLRL